MCVAVPVQISKIVDENNILVRVSDESDIQVSSMMLVEDFKVGDYVITHAGFALRVLDLEEARETLKLFSQISDALKE